MRRLVRPSLVVICVAGMMLAWPVGCSKEVKPRTLDPVADAPNPLPRFLRGTVRYYAELTGFTPQVISGYGFVVGLAGTGSSDTPVPIRVYMQKEAAKLLPSNQISNSSDNDQLTNFDKLHDSMNTAVVLVEAIVPPGAVKGTKVDVVVTAVTGSSTTSLEGGRLWTADLRMGVANPAGPATVVVGQAVGDLFLNPFAAESKKDAGEGGLILPAPYFKENPSQPQSTSDGASPSSQPRQQRPDSSSAGTAGTASKDHGATATPPAPPIRQNQPSTSDDGLSDWAMGGGQLRTSRILNGGTLLTDMPLTLQLRSPGYSRSRAITDAINARFPQEPGQLRPTAEPVARRADEQIRITVPPSFSRDTETFAHILMNVQIAQGGVVERSLQLARWVQENPVDAGDVTWCWVALGRPAIEGFAPLYETAEVIPRFAALNAGAHLGDSRVIEPLVALAQNPDSAVRTDVIRLLGDMQPSPRIGLSLRTLLNDPLREIRVAAFNALVKQNDPLVDRVVLDPTQGFDLYHVPSKYPMVYATRAGQPMIVVFGSGIHIIKPSLCECMSSRFILSVTGPDQPVRVKYRPRTSADGEIYEPSDDLVSFISFLGAKPSRFSSDPGLGMSYADTVRTLYAMTRDKVIPVPFVPQTDVWSQQLLAGRKQAAPEERPIDSASGAATDPTSPSGNPFSQEPPAGTESSVASPPQPGVPIDSRGHH